MKWRDVPMWLSINALVFVAVVGLYVVLLQREVGAEVEAGVRSTAGDSIMIPIAGFVPRLLVAQLCVNVAIIGILLARKHLRAA